MGPRANDSISFLFQLTKVHPVTSTTFGRWNENAGKQRTFRRRAWYGGWGNAATGDSRGSAASAHLRKVRRKSGEMTHLRKVSVVWWRGKRGYRRLSGQCRFCAPSEGETKMRGNDSPSEGGHGMVDGEMRLQATLGAVRLLS